MEQLDIGGTIRSSATGHSRCDWRNRTIRFAGPALSIWTCAAEFRPEAALVTEGPLLPIRFARITFAGPD
jgi:hypothetical protein